VDSDLLGVFRSLSRGKACWPLYLHGQAGVGKTRACLAWLDYIPESRYVTVDEIVTETMEHRDSLTWRLMPGHQLIVVDEAAMRAKPTEIDYQTVKRLADAREDMAIAWVSNATPESLAASYDDRIASRLLCGTVFELKDSDRRMARA
jgi:chromosomal replication initiation ATPase DnaA